MPPWVVETGDRHEPGETETVGVRRDGDDTGAIA
jgi:hypothetical protein